MTFVPLHVHSHDSLLDGLSQPEQIARRCAQLGYQACALTDHGSLSGLPGFAEALHGLESPVKPIAGCELYVCDGPASDRSKANEALTHLCVLAKGDAGWRRLVRAVSESNHGDNFYRKPRLHLERLGELSGREWVVFSGHPGTAVARACFTDHKLAYAARTVEAARGLLHPERKRRLDEQVRRHQGLFGADNFYVEIQLIDEANTPAARLLAEELRECARRLKAPCVATPDAHYPTREHAADHRVLISSLLDTPLRQIEARLAQGEDVGLGCFFKSQRFHIPSPEEMRALHTEAELAATVEIADRCETPTLRRDPLLPQFDCPDGMTPDGLLRRLCEEGLARKVLKRTHPDGHGEYRQRLEMEYGTLTGANLASYFLIVQDYVAYARRERRCLVGGGRGSAAGCLVSYLTDITDIDPIRFGLLFERFLNPARLAHGKGTLPDIDSDFPVAVRDDVIAYCRKKYGEERVCQMAAFSRMLGRGALKDVLRAHSRCDFEEMNKITAAIPDEAAIADELQDMAERGDEPSIVRWALENRKRELQDYCTLRDDGALEGPYAADFRQAMRLEGTKRALTKHPSGLIICSEPVGELVPMVRDKSGHLMAGVDMHGCEVMGLVKFDILGTTVLDKLMDFQHFVRTGRLSQ